MSALETPTVEGSFRIMPADIDATRLFLSAFGKSQVEGAALGLVLYCQEHGSWVPFTKDELTDFFRAAKAAGRIFLYRDPFPLMYGGRPIGGGDEDAYELFLSSASNVLEFVEPDTFRFWWLSPEEGLLVRQGDDGKYRVTELFIERCHEASPKRPSPTT